MIRWGYICLLINIRMMSLVISMVKLLVSVKLFVVVFSIMVCNLLMR